MCCDVVIWNILMCMLISGCLRIKWLNSRKWIRVPKTSSVTLLV